MHSKSTVYTGGLHRSVGVHWQLRYLLLGAYGLGVHRGHASNDSLRRRGGEHVSLGVQHRRELRGRRLLRVRLALGHHGAVRYVLSALVILGLGLLGVEAIQVAHFHAGGAQQVLHGVVIAFDDLQPTSWRPLLEIQLPSFVGRIFGVTLRSIYAEDGLDVVKVGGGLRHLARGLLDDLACARHLAEGAVPCHLVAGSGAATAAVLAVLGE